MTTYPTVNLRKVIKNPAITMPVQIDSHYKIDYLIAQYETILDEENKKTFGECNGDANFIKFMDLIREFRIKVDKDRLSNGTDTAVGSADYRNFLTGVDEVFNGKTILNMLQKEVFQIMRDYNYINSDVDKCCEHFVGTDKYYATWNSIVSAGMWGHPFFFGISEGNRIFNFYFHNFGTDRSGVSAADNFLRTDSTGDAINGFDLNNGNQLNTLIPKIESAWKTYLLTSVSIKKPTEFGFDVLRVELDNTVKNVNQIIQSADYQANYMVLQQTIGKSAILLKQLVNGSFIESAIIKGTNNSTQNNVLIFNKDDMNSIIAVIKPKKSSMDLVSRDELLKEANKKTKSIQDNIDGFTSAAVFGATLSSDITAQLPTVMDNIYNFLETVNKNKIIRGNPTQLKSLYGLMNSTIFKIDENKPAVIKYFTKDEKNKLEEAIEKKHADILGAIIMGNDSKLKRFETHYPSKQFQQGGSNGNKSESKSKYKFKKQSSQVVTSQTGGHSVDYTEYGKNAKKTLNLLVGLEETMNTNHNKITELDKIFFKNKEYFDLDVLEQRNELLIELETLINVTIFIIKLGSDEHKNFGSDLKMKITDFGRNLTNMWKEMRKRVKVTGATDDTLLDELLLKGSMNVGDLQDYFSKQGLSSIVPSSYPKEVSFNQMPFLNTFEGLVKSLNSVDNAAKQLKELTSKGVDIQHQKKTVNEIYTQMYEYYSEIKNIGINIQVAQKQVENNEVDLNKLKNSAADVIKSNIITVDFYMNSMLSTIIAYDSFAMSMGKLISETNKTKNRIDNFEIYLSTMQKICKKYDNPIYATVDADIASDLLFTNKFLIDDTRKKYTDYITNSQDVVKKLTPDLDYQKNLITLNEKYKELSKRVEHLLVLGYILHFTEKHPLTHSIYSHSYDIMTGSVLIEDTKLRIKNIKNNIENISTNIGSTSTKNKLILQQIYVNTEITTQDGLVDEIMRIYEKLLGNQTYYLYFYPELTKKINFPDEIQKIINMYMYPNKDMIANEADRLLGMIDNTNKLDIAKIDHNKFMFILNILFELYISYYTKKENILDKSTSISSNITQKLWEKIDQGEKTNYESAKKLLIRIKTIQSDAELDNKSYIEGKILSYVKDLYSKSVFFTSNDLSGFLNYMTEKINIIPISIYETYYFELNSFYTLVTTYLSEPTVLNPNFNNIINKQKGIREMGINLQNIKMNTIYKMYTVPSDVVLDDFKTTLDTYDPSKGSLSKPSFDEDYKLISKIDTIKLTFNQFVTNTVDIFDFFLQQPDTNLLPKIDTLTVPDFDFKPTANNRLYTTPTSSGSCIATCPITDTNNLNQDIPTYDTTATPFNVSTKLITKNIKLGINATNTPVTPELLSNYSTTIRIINIILDIFPFLLSLKEKLYKFGKDNTTTYPGLSIEGDNSGKQKVRNELKSYLLIFQEKIDAKIRNNTDIALLNVILLPSQMEFQKAITNLNALPLDTITNVSLCSYFSQTYLFLSGLTSFYISYLWPILKGLFKPNVFKYIKTSIVDKQMTKININIESILDLSKLYDPYYKSIGSVATIGVSDLRKTFNKITKDVKPVAQSDIPDKKDIYDFYYDNITTASDDVYPYFHVAIMSKNNNVPEIMEKINKLWTEIAHIDLFSRNIDPAITEINKYIDDKIALIPVINWKDKDIFKTNFFEIVDKFKEIFFNGPASSRQKYIDVLNENESYDFSDVMENMKWISHLDHGCTENIIIESNNVGTLTYGDYTITNTSTDWYDNLTKIYSGDWKTITQQPPGYTDQVKINHENLGRLYRDFKNNTTLNGVLVDIKTVLRNVVSAKMYEYINGVRYFVEKKLEELGKLYAKLNYTDLSNRAFDNINILKDNPTLLPIGKYNSTDMKDYLDNIFKDAYASVPGSPSIDADTQMIYRTNLTSDPNSWTNPKMPKNAINSFSMLRELSSKIQSNIHDNLQTEIEIVTKSIGLNYGLTNHLEKDKYIITSRLHTMDSMMSVLNKVMFNIYFRDTSLLGSAELWKNLNKVGQTYKQIGDIIESKMYSIIERQREYILELSRQKNYTMFNNAIGKQIGDEKVDTKIYKQMSFALIKLYRDILKIILECIGEKSFEDLSEVNKYLSESHFIVLNRCYKLFNWITEEYVEPMKEAQRKLQIDALKSGSTESYDPEDSILRKKVQLPLTLGNIKDIFIEFNAIRDMLDKYKILVMPSVSVFLRINDWAEEPGLDFNPQSLEYDNAWKNKELIFQNDNESNPDTLRVYFENVPSGNVPNLKAKNEAISAEMANVKDSGIKFQTICNSIDYPDADVIANQMATGPLLLDGKGIMLLTYGYSGVGKSDTLFGRLDKQTRLLASPGMLQATLDQLPDGSDIFFRVYELYGLGTQFDFYWNPKNKAGNDKCFPDFYQLLIHHRLKDTGPLALHGADSHVVFTNRYDMLSYVMDLKQPGPGINPITKQPIPTTKVELQTTGDPSDKSRHKSLHPGSVNVDGTGSKLSFNTYRKITRDQYENFSDFVKTIIDTNQRKKGFEFTQILTHKLEQVKPTINNPDSSRSILIYDFQIKKAGTNTFTPFLIYDLPGKEDLFGTYITKNPSDTINLEKKKGSFTDIPGDDSIIKVRKANYVMNPFMASVFDNNIDKTIDYFTKNVDFKAGVSFIEGKLIKKVLDSGLEYSILKKPGIGGAPFDLDNGTPGFHIRDFYNTPPTTFDDLFKLSVMDGATPPNITVPSLIKTDYITDANNFNVYIGKSGGPGAIAYNSLGRGNSISVNDAEKNIYLIVTFNLIYVLIKKKYFDVIVGLINHLVDNKINWTTTKIYAFFEAFYINENISGILHYLLSDPKIVNKSSGFKLQSNSRKSALDTYSNQYKSYFIYKTLINFNKSISKGGISGLNLPTIKVPAEFEPNSPKMGRYPFERKNIEDFLAEYRINPDLSFIVAGMNPQPTTTQLIQTYEAILYRQNKELYNSGSIFRNGIMGVKPLTNCEPSGDGKINDPNTIKITYNDPDFVVSLPQQSDITNIPLIQELIDPYKPKIDNYYIFYLITNTTRTLKGEKQIELLNTSVEFINAIGVDKKKNLCV